ncbi:electron transport complex subunit RsxG [Shewanella sp. JM162201]|uniref:Ion-translocating oxidoreductase complex subunit G n=1 Tax=Shewanella jiangmenensis TaxID=2837387 RepID=A0ABS5V689_9GAMM|nr:electron transport complex subunit RsxG [Shewanella jiangmenensis]MBT1445950.1 electron transport complex subunit RsxG [Shewanella jiangmenensis]
MKQSIIKNGLLLGGFALACTAAVALVNDATKDRIAEQQRLELSRILHQIVPDDIHDNDLSASCILVTEPDALGSIDPMPVYLGTKGGKPVALAIETIAPDGYNGNIRLIVGVDTKGEVLGIRTLSHQETPGLGDKIELRKDDWVLGFNGKRFEASNPAPWRVKKDGGEFDQFTGATITPRAYLNAISRTLTLVEKQKADWFKRPLGCHPEKAADADALATDASDTDASNTDGND